MLKSKGRTVNEKESIVNAIIQADKHNIAFQGFVAINCCKLASSGLDRFRSLLKFSCNVCRDSSTISTSCHVLAAFLQKTFQSNGRVACKLGNIVSAVSQGDLLLPQSAQEILGLLVTMNEREQIILFKDEANIADSHIILDKQVLLSEINGTLFAPENFRQHTDFASSTGVVPSSKIREGFPQYDPEMITKYLTYLEFCQKVDDTETNKLVQLGDTTLASQSDSDVFSKHKDDYYFFPSLVRASPPNWLWKEVQEVVHKWGWCIQCVDSGQFLTSRLLHVLLLRLAFTFPLRASMRPKPLLEEDSPVLTRQCSVWKNGLHWVSQGGVEAIIEVGENYQSVTVMIQYKQNRDVNFAQIRAAVLKEVLIAKNQFCSSVKMVEYVIHPNDVKYPTNSDPILFEMSKIAESLLDTHKKPDVPDVSGKCTVAAEKLIGFEPYSGVDSELATCLFQSSKSNNIERIIPLLAIKLARKSDMFRKIIDPDSIVDEPVSHEVCQDLFEEWCTQQDERVTTEMFRVEILDKYSVLCGRNPLEVTQSNEVVIPEYFVKGAPIKTEDSPTPQMSSSFALASEERCEVSTAEKSFDADPLSVLTHGELSPTTGGENIALPTLEASAITVSETPIVNLIINDLDEVNQELVSLAPKWKQLGRQLGLGKYTLELIEVNYPKDAAFCLTEMLVSFLKGEDGVTPNWRLILSALKSLTIRRHNLAKSIERYVTIGYTDDGYYRMELDRREYSRVSRSTVLGSFEASGQSYGHQQLTADQYEQNTTDAPEQQSADSAANEPVGRKHPYYGDVGVTCPYPTMCTLSLGPQDIYEVEQAVYRVTYKWFHLGLALGLPYHVLKSIPIDCLSIDRCCIEMLRLWLSMGSMDGDPPTRLSLVLALDSPLVSGQECVTSICDWYSYRHERFSNLETYSIDSLMSDDEQRRRKMQKRRVH